MCACMYMYIIHIRVRFKENTSVTNYNDKKARLQAAAKINDDYQSIPDNRPNLAAKLLLFYPYFH